MKKRFLNLFLVMLMVVCVLPMAANAATKCWHNSNSPYCTVVTVEAEAATCAEAGYEEHFYCTFCKKEMKLEGTTYVETTKTVIPATGNHNYEFIFWANEGQEATCTTSAVGVFKCSVCGDPENKTVYALGHDFNGVETITKTATCARTGIKTTKCTRCDAVEEETIAKLDHDYVDVAEVPATCTVAGKTAGVKCSSCYKVKSGLQTIPATGNHDYENKGYKEGSEAACTESGLYLLECKTCGSKTTQTAPATGHTEEIVPGYDATCTEEGRTEAKRCSVCKVALTSQYKTAALGHDFTIDLGYKKDYEPTCVDAGLTVLQCSRCNEKTTRNTPATGHTEEIVPGYDATCTETGRFDGKRCAVCKVTLKSLYKIPALGHDYTVDKGYRVGDEPTCTAAGFTVIGCSRCESETARDAAALGHDFTVDLGYKENAAPTCETAGKKIIGCSRCIEKTLQDVPALGHDKKEDVFRAPTCTKTGAKLIECNNEGCGLFTLEKIEALGHTEEVVPAVAATCTATGLTEGKKCSVCDETLVAQVVTDKISHAWEAVEAQAATCKADGYNAHRQCVNCSETDGKTVIAASAAYHEYENFKCKHCGGYDPDHNHAGTVTSSTASTCTVAGSKSYKCNACGYEWTESVEKAAHVYGADARCTGCKALNPNHQHTYEQTGYSAPACTAAGKVTKQCSVCGDQTETLIDATGHSYSDGKCSNCGTPAACTHSNTSAATTAATCNRAGKKVTTCNGCGAQVASETIPATGNHNYVNGRCSGCGAADPNRYTSDYLDIYIVG